MPVFILARARGNQAARQAAKRATARVKLAVEWSGRKPSGEPCRRVEAVAVAGDERAASPQRAESVELLLKQPARDGLPGVVLAVHEVFVCHAENWRFTRQGQAKFCSLCSLRIVLTLISTAQAADGFASTLKET